MLNKRNNNIKIFLNKKVRKKNFLIIYKFKSPVHIIVK